MKIVFTFLFFLLCFLISAQGIPKEYYVCIRAADSLQDLKKYKECGLMYSRAFYTNGGKGFLIDRYNAACVWSIANYPDSAFLNIDRILLSGDNAICIRLVKEKDLEKLHGDKRWNVFVKKVKENSDKIEARLNKPVKGILDSIYHEDQDGRQQTDIIEKRYGRASRQMDSIWKIIGKKDASNLEIVTKILDKYGWLGIDEIGNQGNSTLFLVIQHSDITTQEKYLPMMREAVKSGKAQGSSLALLEDRVALRQGKKQIYGSQVSRDLETGEYFLSPLEDPDNVDKRRAEVGLQPLAEYVNYWQMKWDVEQYKKDLKAREEKQKK